MTREHQVGGSHEQHPADAPRQCNAALCRLRLQFERTLIVAEDDAYVSYLEGCTAPAYDSNQLHAAVVELSAGVASCNNAMHCAVLKTGRLQASLAPVVACCIPVVFHGTA